MYYQLLRATDYLSTRLFGDLVWALVVYTVVWVLVQVVMKTVSDSEVPRWLKGLLVIVLGTAILILL